MSHPYTNLGPTQFWRTGVADIEALDICGLWRPKFPITPRTRICTAGSCFAQHFSRALLLRGYEWCNFEPAPALLDQVLAAVYNYGVFSFRTGNIYTPKMLRQWLEWAFDVRATPGEIWAVGERVYDPFRPAIEPNGFASADEINLSRAVTLAAIRDAVRQSDVFVFTMGLTESWAHRASGVEYAICPGTAGGQFDPAAHVFVNHPYQDLLDDMNAALAILRGENPQLRVLLTLSPVPLTATASGAHVLTATCQSKSILRAVAAAVCAGREDVDYFPSYEIITSPVYGGRFFAPNMRQVLPAGVDHVMACFFKDQAAAFGAEQAEIVPPKPQMSPLTLIEIDAVQEELMCEEAILGAFAPSTAKGNA